MPQESPIVTHIILNYKKYYSARKKPRTSKLDQSFSTFRTKTPIPIAKSQRNRTSSVRRKRRPVNTEAKAKPKIVNKPIPIIRNVQQGPAPPIPQVLKEYSFSQKVESPEQIASKHKPPSDHQENLPPVFATEPSESSSEGEFSYEEIVISSNDLYGIYSSEESEEEKPEQHSGTGDSAGTKEKIEFQELFNRIKKGHEERQISSTGGNSV